MPIAEYTAWSGADGLPYDPGCGCMCGPVAVPCDPVHGHAVYVEPAVWVHHRLT